MAKSLQCCLATWCAGFGPHPISVTSIPSSGHMVWFVLRLGLSCLLRKNKKVCTGLYIKGDISSTHYTSRWHLVSLIIWIYTTLYLFIVDVIFFYEVNLFYNVQRTNLPFVGKNLRFPINRYSSLYFQIVRDIKYDIWCSIRQPQWPLMIIGTGLMEPRLLLFIIFVLAFSATCMMHTQNVCKQPLLGCLLH